MVCVCVWSLTLDLALATLEGDNATIITLSGRPYERKCPSGFLDSPPASATALIVESTGSVRNPNDIGTSPSWSCGKGILTGSCEVENVAYRTFAWSLGGVRCAPGFGRLFLLGRGKLHALEISAAIGSPLMR